MQCILFFSEWLLAVGGSNVLIGRRRTPAGDAALW